MGQTKHEDLFTAFFLHCDAYVKIYETYASHFCVYVTPYASHFCVYVTPSASHFCVYVTPSASHYDAYAKIYEIPFWIFS